MESRSTSESEPAESVGGGRRSAPPRKIQLIDRLVRVLDSFTPENPELTLTECARSASLNKSSAYRLLSSLEHVGFVERTDLLWRLGPKAVTLATVRLGQIDLRREALPHLKALRHEFRSAVAFGVPEGSDMILVERFDSPDDAFGVTVRLGIRAPIWAGAVGKAVLSRMEPESREQRLNVDEWRRLPADLRDRILTEISLAGGRGYCVDAGEFFSGIKAVAVAVRDAAGDPVAGIGVVLSRERMTDEYEVRIGERLRGIAEILETSARLVVETPHVPDPQSAEA